MEYARECANALSPSALIRSVTSVGTSLTKRVLFPTLPSQRPYRISNRDRSSRKGVVAGSLKQLIEKAVETFLITSSLVTLVLEEDGTVVDTEEFFQSLDDNTNFLLLEGDDKWRQERNGTSSLNSPKKKGIAKITLDLYKLNPKDFIGCLNVRATFYEMYSVSYDFQCLGARRVLRKLLRIFSHLAQIVGHLLLQGGSYVLRWTGEYDEDYMLSKPTTTQ
ncbi:lipid transferase CIDEA [Ambystoma mexicanum]|uniref:lipid transferase CIDEA n=1 Tax=Ambystoma mexicanum TaxID=8296 RepID=UPI0037E75420